MWWDQCDGPQGHPLKALAWGGQAQPRLTPSMGKLRHGGGRPRGLAQCPGSEGGCAEDPEHGHSARGRMDLPVGCQPDPVALLVLVARH